MEPRRTYPDGTGYVRGLYFFRNLPAQVADSLEKKFFLRADAYASEAMERLLKHDLSVREPFHSGWSRFLMSLLHRNPEAVERLGHLVRERMSVPLDSLRAEYEKVREEAGLPSYDEWCTTRPPGDSDRMHLMLMRDIVDSKAVGTLLNSMSWSVTTLKRQRFPLLTSDRPIIMTNGLVKENGHIALPISPTTIFIAASKTETIKAMFADIDKDGAETRINNLVVRQAVKYVYGVDDRQLRFVSNRLGERRRSTPFG